MSYMTDIVWCPTCKTYKKRTEFFAHKKKDRDGKEHLICNDCRRKGTFSLSAHDKYVNWGNKQHETDGSEYIKMLEESVNGEKYTGSRIDYGSVHKVHM